MEPLNILLIEDDDEHVRIISRYIDRAQETAMKIFRENRLGAGLSRVASQHFDAILLDLRLPDSDISETLERTIPISQNTPIVVLSALEDRDLAIKAIHRGAQDYICKATMSSETLVRSIYNAIERKQTEAQLRLQLSKNSALLEVSREILDDKGTPHVIARCLAVVSEVLCFDLVSFSPFPSEEFEGLQLSPLVQMKRLSPLIVSDLDSSDSLGKRSILRKKGAKTGVIFFIEASGIVHGVLNAFSSVKRELSEEEIGFVQAVANALTSSVIRTKLEEELKQNIENLNIANRNKDEFIATLSHELRTPLSVMSGYLHLLKEEENLTDNARTWVGSIEKSLQAEIKLVNDTLDMSRIVTGKMMLDMKKFDFSELLSTAIELISPAALAKDIQVNTSIDPELGVVNGDENRLRQVLWNLLSNAVKFTPEKGTIDVLGKRSGSLLTVSVRDNGIGIEPENLQNVFKRFWQEDSTAGRRFMGLGVGLGIVRHIVELHGGTVAAYSEGRGRGSIFTISIPLVRFNTTSDSSTKPVSTTVAVPKKQVSHALGGIRILLVDDSEDNLVLMKKLLERDGGLVNAISVPEDGLKEAMSANYDILISDIGMPNLDGYELIRKLRTWEKNEQQRKPLPAIALTAFVSSHDISKALDAGFQAHIPKPTDLKRLEGVIKELHS